MSSDSPFRRRRDTDAIAAVALAVLLLAFPVMSDVAFVMLAMQKYLLAAMWMLACYGVAVFPWLRSLLRHRREPDVWDGRGKLIATGIILGIHVILFFVHAIHWCVTSWSS